jgi:hypothetical protein
MEPCLIFPGSAYLLLNKDQQQLERSTEKKGPHTQLICLSAHEMQEPLTILLILHIHLEWRIYFKNCVKYNESLLKSRHNKEVLFLNPYQLDGGPKE